VYEDADFLLSKWLQKGILVKTIQTNPDVMGHTVLRVGLK